MNTNNIFPNIGDAAGNYGTAIPLLKGKDGLSNPLEAFSKVAGVTDLGHAVFEILELQVKEEAGKLLDQGYKLIKSKGNEILNKAFTFDLPAGDYKLIDLPDMLKIYIEYKATEKKSANHYTGKFDFDVDSFAGDLADTWKGRMNNMAMVVDLGPLKRIITIKGNFNSQKGKETNLGSISDDDESNSTLPAPELEFSDALKPVVKLLEILQELSVSESYKDVLKKGLKIAMSNSANIWEYKFEATKEIAMVRFPAERSIYESPGTPLKLEASMSVGVFFNAALKVTTDPKQLIPTAGAFFKFHGGLQVMCVSVGGAAVFAVGNLDLTLSADTSPKVAVTMKFGFGAQVVVGLPVVGSASVLFMVGLEIYADTTGEVAITAFVLFRGHAELLGGLVSVTITIEASGTVVRKNGPDERCNCIAKVTFAIDISIFLIIDISFSESWEETRQLS